SSFRGAYADRSAVGVLVERFELLAGLRAAPGVPTPAEVTADPAGVILGRPRRRVPQIAMVEDHVTAVAVDLHLAGDLLEAERHPVGRPQVTAGDDAQEAVGG